MDGSNLACGAVSLVKDVKNPISLARRVMEGTPHVFFAGSECTSQYASQFGLEKVDPSYFDTETRLRQLHEAKNREVIALDHNLPTKNDSNTDSADTCAKVVHTQNDGTGKGTVGCVCMFNGHVAAGTSTGGMTNKACGRVGDTPVIGAGTYANDKAAAISATGHGEEFIRHCASFDVISRMTLGGLSLHSAMKETVFNILPDKSGGLIGVDAHGNVSMQFNCGGMFRGTCHSGGEASIGIWDEDENIQIKV